MARMHINKSIEINAPAATIFEKLNDFHTWRAWSPWLIMDPDASVDVEPDGKAYTWTGDLTGEGAMKILGEEPNKAIDYDLFFIKPWKSNPKVRFELEEQGDKTKVSWLMDSPWPFFLFWMKKTMTALIGKDYERGLSMLKEYIEDGEVHSTLGFEGATNYPGCTFVGLKTSCTMEGVGAAMEADFTALWNLLKDDESNMAGAPFSIYHKFDMVKEQVVYTAGIPVNQVPDNLPSNFLVSSIPATKVQIMKHTGPYHHLGNAWTTLYSMHRNKKFKMNKSVDPFEVYVNDPGNTDPKDLITEVHFAMK